MGYRKEIAKQEEDDIAQLMEYERRAAVEKLMREKHEKEAEWSKVKAVNQNQIIMREEAKKVSYVEAVREKQQVQEVVDQIAKEDAIEEATRRRKQEETRTMLRSFMKEQEERQRRME